jgi:endoglucanase
MKTDELLKKLCNEFGASSYEDRVMDLVENSLKEEYKELDFYRPGTGSLVAKYGKGGKKVAFFAHIDEIGVVVSNIVDEEFARVEMIGGVDARTLIAKKVKFVTKHGEKIGVVGMLAPHLQAADSRGKSPSFDELFVDFSFSGGTKDISVGDIGYIDFEAVELQNKMISAKALDNRVGAVVIAKALDYLKEYKFDGELYLCFNRGEEIGLVGAKGMAYEVNPDYAIVVDVAFGNENIPHMETLKIGEGPAIATGAPITPKVFDDLTKIAEENNLNFQLEVAASRSGTEADIVQITRTGIATGLVSVPILNMHSPVEVVDVKDIEAAAKLLAIFAVKEVRE